MKDLSKIDFTKLKLPDFRGLKTHAAKAPAGPFPYIEAEGYYPIANRSQDEPYTWDTRRATTDELIQIVAMCKTVDAFITAELAKQEPKWVEIKPSEVERLRKVGATVRHEMSEETVRDIMGNVVARVPGAELCAVDLKTVPANVALYEPEWVEVKWTEVERLLRSGVNVMGLGMCDDPERWIMCGKHHHGVKIYTYHVDAKTVPAGVNLYEPEWIDVPWMDVESLDKYGATTMARVAECHTDNWVSRGALKGYSGSSKFTYRADRKTCPDGYRPTVGNVGAYNKWPVVGDGFEFCEKSEATEAAVWSVAEEWSEWRALRQFSFGCASHLYRFRRPVAKRSVGAVLKGHIQEIYIQDSQITRKVQEVSANLRFGTDEEKARIVHGATRNLETVSLVIGETVELATLATTISFDTSRGVNLGGVLAPGTWKLIAVRVGE